MMLNFLYNNFTYLFIKEKRIDQSAGLQDSTDRLRYLLAKCKCKKGRVKPAPYQLRFLGIIQQLTN